MFKKVLNIAVLGVVLGSGVSLAATTGDVKRKAQKFDAPPTEKMEKRQGISGAPVPVVSLEGDKVRIDPNFVARVPTYAEMASTSYHIVAGRNAQTVEGLEKFQGQGFEKITFFYGDSGSAKFDKEAKKAQKAGNAPKAINRDIAGFVATNPKTGESVVVFHGSQDNHDWQNNFDAKMVPAREKGLNFDGKVHNGFASRYESSKAEIYQILERDYNNLDAKTKAKYSIAVTGHSLGGAMTQLGYADIATDLAPRLFGKDYKNNEQNRVRGFAMSPARTMDAAAVNNLVGTAGVQNLVIDKVAADPVGKFGFGETTTKMLKNASKYGIARFALLIMKGLGLSETSNPQKAAELYGNAKHLGVRADQKTSDVVAVKKSLPMDPHVKAEIEAKSPVKRAVAKVVAKVVSPIGAIHKGGDNLLFEPRLAQGEGRTLPNGKKISSLEENLNREHQRRLNKGAKPMLLVQHEAQMGTEPAGIKKAATQRPVVEARPTAPRVVESRPIQIGKNRPQKVASVTSVNKPTPTRPVVIERAPVVESARKVRQPQQSRQPSGAHGQVSHGQVTRARARTLP